MGQETGSIELARVEPADRETETAQPASFSLPRLGLSTLAIAAGAIAIACLIAAGLVLILYARMGTDGLTELYQELRFDFRLKTLAGALVVGMLYVGTTLATLGAATLWGKGAWPRLIAWTRVRERRRLLPAIFVITLLYAIIATLGIALTRSTRIIVSGHTDYALVGTITTNLIILAPIAEELFFRGWLYTGLRARLPFWPSFLVTAVLFAGIHWDANHRRILLVLPLAAALGILREVTGSIKPTIALHAAYNLIIVVVTLLVT